MRLYKTEADNIEGDTVQAWDGTQADARATRAHYKQLGHAMIETTEVDVPTAKTDLLAWLNKHMVTEK